jgi:hypothetical protein
VWPVRVRVALPPGGLGERLNRMHAGLDATAGAGSRAMTPSSVRGVVKDAMAGVCFCDPTVAPAAITGAMPWNLHTRAERPRRQRA